jgi:hypothetical protein
MQMSAMGESGEERISFGNEVREARGTKKSDILNFS